MLSLAVVRSLSLARPSIKLVTVCVLGLFLVRLASAARLQLSESLGNIGPAMRMQKTAAPSLNAFINRLLNQHNGSRQIRLLPLATLLRLCCVHTVKASPAFLARSSFGMSHKALTLYHADEPNSRFFRSPKLLFVRRVPPAPFEAKKHSRCYAISVTKRWRTPAFAAQDPRPGANPPVVWGGALEGYTGRSDFTNINHQFHSSSQGCYRRGSRNAVSAGFASTYLPSKSFFSSFKKQSVLLHAWGCADRESAIPPGAQCTFASTATAAGEAAPETPAKDSSLLVALKCLRTLTGCSVVACREALEASKGDIHAAVDWLRRRGLAVTSRQAADTSSIPYRRQTEGVIAVASWRASSVDEAGSSRQNEPGKQVAASTTGCGTHEGEVALKLSCSTDFVARNKRITDFARRAAVLLADHLRRIGLRELSTTPTTTTTSAGHQDCTRADTVSLAQQGHQPPSKFATRPSDRSGKIVVLRGARLVERLLSLPWSPDQEASDGNEDTATAENVLFSAGNFFEDQQHLVARCSRKKKGQLVQVSEKEEGPAQESIKRGQPTTKGAMNKHAVGKTQSTIREELQYLSSIVKEPLSITDAVAIEAPVDSGAVASYVHGIIDKQVGTLAVLAALAVDREEDGGAQRTVKPTRRSLSAPMKASQTTRNSQGFQSEHHQRNRRVATQSKSETAVPGQQLAEEDAPQPTTHSLSGTAARYGLTERMRNLAENICMQIAAGRPLAVDENSLDRDLLQHEEGIYRAQAEAAGKPADTIERMVTGKVNKWLKGVLLLKQTWLLDDSGMIVEQKLSDFALQQHLKTAPRIEAFVQLQVH